MNIDRDRISRLKSLLEDNNVDVLIVLDDVNFRYLAGGLVDYSIAYLTNDGVVGIISPLMEMDRAKENTWADVVIGYSRDFSSDDVIKADSNLEAFKKIVNEKDKVAVPFSYISYSRYLFLENFIGKGNLLNGDDIVFSSRMVKTNFEINFIKMGIEIVDAGIKYAIDNVSKGISEEDLAVSSLYFMKKLGADKIHDYLIVASGERSSLPHGRASSRKFRSGDPVTLDYVASREGYFGDETRTIFIDKVDQELKKIYEIVLNALGIAIEGICEGVKASEIDRLARDYISKERYGKHFIHSTGHGIGLEVHEKPSLSSRDDTQLKRNMVVTVEPGIYIPKLGGVRIEEDVLVTSKGYEVLTKNPRELIIV